MSIPFGSNAVTITNATPGGGLCIFDAGAVIPDNNTVPAVMIGNTIVADGPDDYLFSFASPISAVGFRDSIFLKSERLRFLFQNPPRLCF